MHADKRDQAKKKLQKSAEAFTDTLARMGGGSVSINGVEIVSVPPAE